MSTKEIWNTIVNFSRYQISNRGTLRDIKTGKIILFNKVTREARIKNDNGEYINIERRRLLSETQDNKYI